MRVVGPHLESIIKLNFLESQTKERDSRVSVN